MSVGAAAASVFTRSSPRASISCWILLTRPWTLSAAPLPSGWEKNAHQASEVGSVHHLCHSKEPLMWSSISRLRWSCKQPMVPALPPSLNRIFKATQNSSRTFTFQSVWVKQTNKTTYLHGFFNFLGPFPPFLPWLFLNHLLETSWTSQSNIATQAEKELLETWPGEFELALPACGCCALPPPPVTSSLSSVVLFRLWCPARLPSETRHRLWP